MIQFLAFATPIVIAAVAAAGWALAGVLREITEDFVPGDPADDVEVV